MAAVRQFWTSSINSKSTKVSIAGPSTISEEANLVLREDVTSPTRRILRRRLPFTPTHGSVIPRAWSSSISVSDYGDTMSTSSTIPGLGETSGKFIKALGKMVIRAWDEVRLHCYLSELDRNFPHGKQIFWESDDGEQIYKEIIDFLRPGEYCSRVYNHAMRLLLIQIGHCEVKQLIRALANWDSECIGDFITRLMNPILKLDRDPTAQNFLGKAYIRYQDAPHIDPLVPFASFLLQLSPTSVAAYEASTRVGAHLLSEIPDTDYYSLTRQLLQTIVFMRNPISPLHRDTLLSIVRPSECTILHEVSHHDLPADISQWKFSWVLSHIAQGEAHWNILIRALAQGTLDQQKALLFRIISSILPSEYADPHQLSPSGCDALQMSIDKHLSDRFHLLCQVGTKSEHVVYGKDSVKMALRFVLHIMKSEIGSRVVFIDPNYFVRVMQYCIPSLAGLPIPEVIHNINEQGIEWYTHGVGLRTMEQIYLCWELFEIISKCQIGVEDDEA
ncbi:hypothetical protein BDZ94DRAFT_1322530 [Collybia nuda]|uniref:Uncharacterized protein n=1 Tax=Collybia nuda TaxID=64659 RepID=A0A9P5Y311_9AGAR|nr:hypothetical protein BDZ94DRAFT_1322530 [Collybia nuda]